MSQADLIPLTSAKAQEIGKLGGKVRSPEKKYAQLQEKSASAKCKNCKATCFLKTQNIESNPECICTIPRARAYSIFYQMPVFCEEVINKLEQETITKMLGVCSKPADLKMLHDVLDKKKNTDYPKVNKNLNMNLEKGEYVIKIKYERED